MLGISLAAILAGANDLRAIFRWGRRLRPEALRLLGIESGRAPCHATYHYFFRALDADALAATLGRYALGEAAGGHIAIDGKSLRGSVREDAKALHVLSAFATDLGAVIGDLVVPPEANEITAALTLLKALPLEGAVVTGDAIFTQRRICRRIRDGDGHYLFVVKDNQPEMRRNLAIAPGSGSGAGPGDDSPPLRSPRPTCAERQRWKRGTAGSRRAASPSRAKSSPISPGPVSRRACPRESGGRPP